MSRKKTKPVYELDENYNIVRKYKSSQEVIDTLGGKKSNLSLALNRWGYTFLGKIFVRKEDWDKVLKQPEHLRWVQMVPERCAICRGKGKYKTKINGEMKTVTCNHKIPRIVLERKLNKYIKDWQVLEKKIQEIRASF